ASVSRATFINGRRSSSATTSSCSSSASVLAADPDAAPVRSAPAAGVDIAVAVRIAVVGGVERIEAVVARPPGAIAVIAVVAPIAVVACRCFGRNGQCNRVHRNASQDYLSQHV